MNQIIKQKSQRSYQIIASFFENILSWIVLLGIIIYGYFLLKKYFFAPSLISIPGGFQNFLADVLVLVIGIEFMKTFTNRTPESVMEILLFAVTRQVILYHESMVETLAGCTAIILLLSAYHYFTFLKLKQKATASANMLDIISANQ